MKVTVARTLDDFMKVMVIRGIIFIGEHGHRYNMEFDEHELSNRTHMLALDDTNEPIGIMRVCTVANRKNLNTSKPPKSPLSFGD